MKLISVTSQLLQLDWIPAPAVDDGPLNDWGRLAITYYERELMRGVAKNFAHLPSST